MDINANSPSKDPHLPPMGRLGDLFCPRASQTIAEAKLEEGVLTDLALKVAYTSARFTPDNIAERLRVSSAVGLACARHLSGEGWVEETMSSTREKLVFRITD